MNMHWSPKCQSAALGLQASKQHPEGIPAGSQFLYFHSPVKETQALLLATLRILHIYSHLIAIQ